MKYNLHIVKTKIIGKVMKDKSRLTFKLLNYQLHAAIHLQQQDGVAKLSNICSPNPLVLHLNDSNAH